MVEENDLDNKQALCWGLLGSIQDDYRSIFGEELGIYINGRYHFTLCNSDLLLESPWTSC